METNTIKTEIIENQKPLNFEKISNLLKYYWLNTPWQVEDILKWCYASLLNQETAQLLKQSKVEENYKILKWIEYITEVEIKYIQQLTNMILDI